MVSHMESIFTSLRFAPLALLIAACAENAPGSAATAPPPTDDMVSVTAASVKLGTWRHSENARSASVDSFRISAHPVSLNSYQLCVRAGACAGVMSRSLLNFG